MTEAVIVSTARTPIGKAFRGALNNTEGPTMAGHVIGEAVRRAKVEPGEVEDVRHGMCHATGHDGDERRAQERDPRRIARHRRRHDD